MPFLKFSEWICYHEAMKQPVFTIEPARAAKNRVMELISGVGQVNGVGITRVRDSYAVKINPSEQPPAGVEVPAEMGGVPIVHDVVRKYSKRPHTRKYSTTRNTIA